MVNELRAAPKDDERNPWIKIGRGNYGNFLRTVHGGDRLRVPNRGCCKPHAFRRHGIGDGTRSHHR